MNAILVLLLRLIFVLLSYIFIGWIGYSIYTDLNVKRGVKKWKAIPSLTFQIEIDQEQINKSFSIPEIIIGRDPTCDFPIDDETISLRHIKISFHHKQWWAEDLCSTNGSYINEILIKEPVALTNGDQLRLGRKILSIKTNTSINGDRHE
jgi:pSer/pThr/pTyr-binding forkhead associated (FHA) protein